MSWLNSSLSNIKGQITNFANEVLSEGVEGDQRSGDELEEANKRLLELQNIVSNQNLEIANLRKHNAELSKRDGDRHRTIAAGPSTQNVRNMEDSWIWTEDDVETDETSSQEEKKRRSPSAELKYRIQELEQENISLNSNLEALDSQHNIASQKLIEIKNELQKKYEGLMEDLRIARSSNKNSGEIEQLKEENSRLKIDFDKVQEDLCILQDENFELQRITQELKAKADNEESKRLREELKILKKKQEDLVQENDRLKTDIDKVDEDRSVLQDDNFSLQEEIENLKKNLPTSDSTAIVEGLKNENLGLKTEIGNLTKLKSELDMLKIKEKALKDDNERLKIDFDKVQDDFSTLQDENFELQEEIEMLKNGACSTETIDNLEGLKKENLQLKVEIETLLKTKNELEVLKKNETDLKNEIENLKTDKDKIDEDRCVLQDKNFELQQEIETLKDMSNNLDSLRKENTDLKNELEELKKSDSALRQEIERLKTDLANGESNSKLNAMLMEENKDVLKMLENQEGSIRTQRVKERELLHENAKMTSNLERLQRENAYLQEYNVDLQGQMENLLNSAISSDAPATIESLTSQNEKLKADAEALQETLDTLGENKNSLQNANLELQEEIRVLKNNCTADGISLQTLRKENADLKQEIERNSRLKVDVEKLEEDLCVLQDQNLEYQGSIANLNGQIETHVAEIDTLKQKIVTLNIQNDDGNVKNLKEELEQYDRMKIDYEKVQEDLSVLQDQNFELQQKISESCDKSVVEALENQIQNLKEEKEKSIIDLGKLRDELTVLQTENSELQQRLSTVCDRSELEKLENQIKKLVDEKECMKIDLEKAQSAQQDDLVRELREKITKLQVEKQSISLELAHYEKECNDLMKNNDGLFLELEEIKSTKLETISEKNEESFLNLEQQLESCSTLNQSLEDQYKDLGVRLEETEKEKSDLIEKLNNNNKNLTEAKKQLETFKQNLQTIEQEKSNLLFELNEFRSKENSSGDKPDQTLPNLQAQYKELSDSLNSLKQERDNLLQENGYLKQELQRTIQSLEERNPKIQILDSTSGRIQHLDNTNIERLHGELEAAVDMIESLKAQNTELYSKSTSELQNSKAIEITLRHQIDELKQQLAEADANRNILQNTFKTLDIPNVNQLQADFLDTKAKYEQLLSENENLKKMLEQSASSEETNQLRNAYAILANEKAEWVKCLKTKHEESDRYYAEIQRLTSLLQAEMSKSAQAGVDPSSLEKLTDQVGFLREKCDILTNSLVTEQSNVKLLNQEKREAEEKASTSSRELERLRQHLVEVENSHTQEIMELDMRNNELQAKINSIEEHAIYNNTAYTSASIRANQQAETLQAQLILMSQQRDELLTKMSDTEDKYNRQIAALTNLQCALEQFQLDKEQDIRHSTERLRSQLEREQKEQAVLRSELTAVRTQMAEQQQGLMAAGRLAGQLETSQATVQALRLDLKQSQDKYAALHAKMESAQSNQADKIEKSLVKNLMLGYITSSQQNDKAQILKIISAVLDFNQSECDRIGLNSNQKSSWFGGSVLRLGEEGLAKAFVEFLEKESLPRSKESGLSLLQIPHDPPATSTKSDPAQAGSSTSVPVSSGNALLSQATHTDNVLPTFAPPRSASSILKDVLKDNNS